MAKNYRTIYESYYKVKLRTGTASIHHLDWNHNNSGPCNLVAIPQELHDKINIYAFKFPQTLKNILKYCGNYVWNIKKKNLVILNNYVTAYLELQLYIDIRNDTKQYGLPYVYNKYDKDTLEKIYVIN
jgi:hypothetical protein